MSREGKAIAAVEKENRGNQPDKEVPVQEQVQDKATERERVHVVIGEWTFREDEAVHWLSHGDGSLEMVGGGWRKLPAGLWTAVYRGMPDGSLLVQVPAEVMG